jgi:hypothetical protein
MNEIPSKLPAYMVTNQIDNDKKELVYHSNNYIPLPSDPFNMLMYKYPKFWSETFQNCIIN